MKLKRFLTAEDAVSSVIATILMIAIVVVLASIISTYVLGMAEEIRDPAPQATFEKTQTGATAELTGGGTVSVTNVTLTHKAGDTLEAGTVEMTVNGKPAIGFSDTSSSTVVVPYQSGEITASDSATVAFYADGSGTPTHGDTIEDNSGLETGSGVSLAKIGSGDVVRIRWTSSDGDRSAFLTRYEVD
jgi:FlaG/FlaF family flagellin (archaellin)